MSLRILAWALAAALLATLLPVQAAALPNAGCLACHGTMGFPTDGLAQSAHAEQLCSDCHRQFADDPHGGAEVAEPSQEWIRQVIDIESAGVDPLAWASCGDCHEDQVTAMSHSHHLDPALEDGSPDGAYCGDCHGPPHTIEATPTSIREKLAFIDASCGNCHANPDIIASHDLNPDVVFTFRDSLHGRAARLGREDAPSCVDCHDAHAVVGADHPDSPMAVANRVAVCGECHAGANENFASIPSHTRITASARPAEYWVSVFFVFLTLTVIPFMLLHISLDALSNLRRARSRTRR